MDYQEQLIRQIFSPSKPSEKSLLVYHNNYLENAYNALSVEYPSILTLLGEQSFRKIFRAYIHKFSKTSFDWADFGQHVEDYLLAQEELSELPYLAELAQMDWACRCIEKTEDVPFDGNSFSLLHSTHPRQLRFVPASGMRLLEAYFPLDLFFSAAKTSFSQAGDAASLKKAINDAINTPLRRSFLLWRHEYQPRIQALEKPYTLAFQLILNNASVEDVLEALGKSAEDMTEWLQHAISEQQICAIRLLDK